MKTILVFLSLLLISIRAQSNNGTTFVSLVDFSDKFSLIFASTNLFNFQFGLPTVNAQFSNTLVPQIQLYQGSGFYCKGNLSCLANAYVYNMWYYPANFTYDQLVNWTECFSSGLYNLTFYSNVNYVNVTNVAQTVCNPYNIDISIINNRSYGFTYTTDVANTTINNILANLTTNPTPGFNATSPVLATIQTNSTTAEGTTTTTMTFTPWGGVYYLFLANIAQQACTILAGLAGVDPTAMATCNQYFQINTI